MRTSDVAELGELTEPLRDRLAWLLNAAGGAVWIVSGRRTTAEQVDLRRQHCGSSYYDIWQKPASQCSPPTARPGTSQHEVGRAADLGGDLSLAARLARSAGLVEPVKGEPWHFEATGGPSSSAAVQALAGTVASGIPFGVELPGLPGGVSIPNPLGGIADAVEKALGSVLGSLVDPLLKGLGRIALVGVLVAGGVGLVVLGGIRGTQGVSS